DPSSIQSGGVITIRTYSTQPLPRNFDLTSTVPTEVALPGSLFSVGDSSVNGTAGSIRIGTTNINAVDVHELSLAGIEIRTIGSSSLRVLAPRFPEGVISAETQPGIRTLVTPGEALALYQVSRGLPQTIGVDSLGRVTDRNPDSGSSPGIVTIPAYEMTRQFTSFNVATASGLNRVTVNVAGP